MSIRVDSWFGSSLQVEGVEVFWADIGDFHDDLDAWARGLSAAERDRAERFKFQRDRDRYIWRQALLRFALAERLDCEPEAIEYATGPNGKPCLGGHFQGNALRFNLSHSDGLMALAFAERIEVGVDVERVRPMTDLEALAERCFTAGERIAWRELDPVDRNDMFFRIWTRKEAVLKAMGTGLSVEPQSVEVWGRHPTGRIPNLVAEERVTDPSGQEWRLWTFQPKEGWRGALSGGLAAAGDRSSELGGGAV